MLDFNQQVTADTSQFKTVMSDAMTETGHGRALEASEDAQSITAMIQIIERNISRSDKLLDEISFGQERLFGEHERIITRLRTELEEKERVIQFLKPFRFTSPHYWWVRLTTWLSPRFPLLHQLYHRTVTHIRMRLKSRLGEFYHHPPRSLVIPQRYYTTKLRVKKPPLISIVTPSFNQGNFIGRTIGSVVNQGYPRLEYIIQDGGSTDDTWRVIEGVRSKLAFYELRPDKGQSHAINLGFEKSHGEIMAYLNSDDLLMPGSLNYVANYFATHPKVDAVYGHRIIIDENDNEVGRWVLPPHNQAILDWVDYVPQETLFWRRNLWEKVSSRVDDRFRFAVDWDLLLRFQHAGAKIVRLPRFLGAFRVHSNQKTSTQLFNIGHQEMGNLRERTLGHRPSYHEVNRAIRGYLVRHIMYQKLYRLGLLRH